MTTEHINYNTFAENARVTWPSIKDSTETNTVNCYCAALCLQWNSHANCFRAPWNSTAVTISTHTLNTCTKMHRDCWVHTMGGTRISELGGSEGNRIIYSQLLIRKRTDTYSQCHTAIFYCHDWRPYVLIIVTVIPVVFLNKFLFHFLNIDSVMHSRFGS